MTRYIDSEKFLENEIKRCGCVPLVGSCTTDNESLAYQLAKAPTADVVEVKHGYWKPTNIPAYFGGVIYECSLCGAKDGDHTKILGKYCWRCGAKMDGRSDSK